MSNNVLRNRIDFVALVTAKDCNPNGDPLNGNRPRETYDGHGLMTNVCIKHKLRRALNHLGQNVLILQEEDVEDGFNSIKARVEACTDLKLLSKGKGSDKKQFSDLACKTWFDVRAFGQVFAFNGGDEKGASVGIRGPVSIQQALTVSPIDIVSTQITKCVNGNEKDGKASDTMGMMHSVPFGLYIVRGTISCQLAEKTGFTEEDAELLKQSILTMFDDDQSVARPAGSMEVRGLYWFKHQCKTPAVSPAAVYRSIKIVEKEQGKDPVNFEDYEVLLDLAPGVPEPEVYNL